MPVTLYDSGEGRKPKQGATSVASGVVKSPCDLVMQGKTQVRLTSLGIDVWARMVGVGGGDGRGLVFFHQPGDEVLVAFNAEDPRDAFILGGMWSNQKSLPASTPADTISKRTLRTGFTPALGHQIEFDDVLQTITITAATGQTIVMSPTGIKVQANKNTTIDMTASPGAGPGVVQVSAAGNKVTISPAGVEIFSASILSLKANSIDLNAANVSVRGIKLSLNS